MRSPDALSNRQKDILDYIEDFVQDHGYPPAIRQIQEQLDISSTSVVAYNLKALESKGMIKREGKVSRGITMSDATPVNTSRRRGAKHESREYGEFVDAPVRCIGQACLFRFVVSGA